MDKVLRAAENLRLREPQRPSMLNALSVLSEPRRHIKTALKERIRALVGAYISLATFVEDEDVSAVLDDPKKSKAVYRQVLSNIEKNEAEIRDFLRKLATNMEV